MRTRTARTTVVASLVLAAGLAASASAAHPTGLTLKDQAGDANAVNDQGFGSIYGYSPPEMSGPGSQPGKDILSLTLSPTSTAKATMKAGKKSTTYTCTGFTAALELAAPPTPGTRYEVLGSTAKNTSAFTLVHDISMMGTSSTRLVYSGAKAPMMSGPYGLPTMMMSSDKSTPLVTPAKVMGSKIVFTVLPADLKAAGETAPLTVSAPGVEVRGLFGPMDAPLFDRLKGERGKDFKLCSK